MGPRWYAARTQARSEFLAANELQRDGIQVFLPRVMDPHPRPGRTFTPLFPGYLFLRCDSETTELPTFRPGHRILGWVRFGDEVPWLPDEAIDAIRDRSESINRQGGLWRRFQPGDKVQVVSGHLEGFAEVAKEAKSPKARVQILMEFMGRLVRAQVPWENLQPLGELESNKLRIGRRTRGGGRWIRGRQPRAAAAG